MLVRLIEMGRPTLNTDGITYHACSRPGFYEKENELCTSTEHFLILLCFLTVDKTGSALSKSHSTNVLTWWHVLWHCKLKLIFEVPFIRIIYHSNLLQKQEMKLR